MNLLPAVVGLLSLKHHVTYYKDENGGKNTKMRFTLGTPLNPANSLLPPIKILMIYAT